VPKIVSPVDGIFGPEKLISATNIPRTLIFWLSKFSEKWKGIGIRIEDDVLVTDTNPEVLSIAALKEISDLEFWNLTYQVNRFIFY